MPGTWFLLDAADNYLDDVFAPDLDTARTLLLIKRNPARGPGEEATKKLVCYDAVTGLPSAPTDW